MLNFQMANSWKQLWLPGDGGVDISPIADLMETEVYEIGLTLGISQAILTCPSTDGLWQDNRTDQSQIGAADSELQRAMLFDAAPHDEKLLSARDKEVLDISIKFNCANRHKIVPIVGAKTPAELR